MDDTDLDAQSGRVDVRLQRVDGRFDQMDARFAQVDARFERVDRRFDQVDARFEQVDARFEQVNGRFEQVDATLVRLEELIKAEGAITRRHFEVVAEDMKGQVKLIAEGHSVLAEHIVDVKGGIERLETGQADLVLRVSAVESRMSSVAQLQRVVLTEVRGLAAK